MITVFADGSGTTGGPAGIGYVAFDGDVPHSEGSLPLRNATNQQAELLAAAYALHNLPAGSEIVLVSDSEYVVKGWNEKRRRRKNLAHWQRLEIAVARHRVVTFVWTRGHNGTAGNERADELAGAARRQALDAAMVAAA